MTARPSLKSFDSPEREISIREEVKTMTYTKPEIVPAGCAAKAIQGRKPIGQFADANPTKHQTLAAYEADE